MTPPLLLARGRAQQCNRFTAGDAFGQFGDGLSLLTHLTEVCDSISIPLKRPASTLPICSGVQFDAGTQLRQPLVPDFVRLSQAARTIPANQQPRAVVRA